MPALQANLRRATSGYVVFSVLDFLLRAALSRAQHARCSTEHLTGEDPHLLQLSGT